MHLAIRVLGLELLSIEASTDEGSEGEELAGGTTSATPIGFTPSHGDQRWEQGSEL